LDPESEEEEGATSKIKSFISIMTGGDAKDGDEKKVD